MDNLDMDKDGAVEKLRRLIERKQAGNANFLYMYEIQVRGLTG